ncbi:MAG: YncE family protein [Verrucomicrobia bacterium]|nr:YncE family protein [Verrucomicrobiota bacterium]
MAISRFRPRAFFLVVSPDGTMVYVPLSNGTVTTLDYIGNAIGTITTGGWPTQAVFSSDGAEAYVSDSENSDVLVIDTATNTFSTIPTGGPTFGLAIDGTNLYATGTTGAVYVIDTATKKVTATITISNPTDALLGLPALTPDGKFLYVPVAQFDGILDNGQTLLVINTKTKKIEGKPIQLGSVPLQIVTTAGGKFGYLTNGISGAVDVIKLLP